MTKDKNKQEREAFEAWVKATIGSQADLRFMLQDYSNGFTNDLWQAWQACAALLQPQVIVRVCPESDIQCSKGCGAVCQKQPQAGSTLSDAEIQDIWRQTYPKAVHGAPLEFARAILARSTADASNAATAPAAQATVTDATPEQLRAALRADEIEAAYQRGFNAGYLERGLDDAEKPAPAAQATETLTEEYIFEVAAEYGWTIKGDHGQWIVCHTNAASNLVALVRNLAARQQSATPGVPVAEVAAGNLGNRLMWHTEDAKSLTPVGTLLYATPASPVIYSEARKAYIALTNAVVFDGDRPHYIATKAMMDCFEAFFATPADAASEAGAEWHDIGRMLHKAAAILPDGYEINVRAEHGWAGVEMRHPDDVVLQDFDDGESTISEQIKRAIDAAMSKQAQKGGAENG